jgi:hypothetical protein
MKEYFLVLFMWWSNPAMAVVDGLSYETCQTMGQNYVKDTRAWDAHSSYVCVERPNEGNR